MNSKKTSSNDKTNVIPFPERHPKTPDNSPFADLAKKLENRLDKIESDLKKGLGLIESDIQSLTKKNKNLKDTAWREDVDKLSKVLETRIQKALEDVLKRSDTKTKADHAEIRWFQSMAGSLGGLLSFDFFKGILNRLHDNSAEIDYDEFGMDPEMVLRIKPFINFLYEKYWRVKTTGINHIPNDGQALIVGNHSGTLPYDGAMLAAAIYNEHPVRHDARFLVENFVYHMPILGTLMYRIGGVRACPENAERLLAKGHLVVVFPEGVKGIGKYYSERYKLQRFGRGGFIKLCIKTKCPLIPVGIVGAEEIHPIIFKSNVLAKTIGVPYIPITPTFPLLGLLGMIPFPTKWSIHFGKPIQFNKYSDATLEDEILIHQLSEDVRDEIQQIIYDLLKKRRSVWVG